VPSCALLRGPFCRPLRRTASSTHITRSYPLLTRVLELLCGLGAVPSHQGRSAAGACAAARMSVRPHWPRRRIAAAGPHRSGARTLAGYRSEKMISSQTAVIYSYVLFLIGSCDFGIDKRISSRSPSPACGSSPGSPASRRCIPRRGLWRRRRGAARCSRRKAPLSASPHPFHTCSPAAPVFVAGHCHF
jgi:hypothetical protein